MLFILVLSVLTFFCIATVMWALTERLVTGPLRSEGPKPIRDALRRRNRSALGFAFFILASSALLEALWLRYSYGIQDLLADALDGGVVPMWGIVEFASGSISWALYLGLLTAVIAGIIAGTLYSCRSHIILKNTGPGQVLL
jgi:hypothetical protein